MAYVEIPRDLTKIKTKLVGGLTKRQLIGFGVAGIIGFPTYFGLKQYLPDEIALITLILVSTPAVLFAVYEKDGIPAEEIFKSWLKFKYLNQPVRVYKTTKNNRFLGRGMKQNARKSTNSKPTKTTKQTDSRTRTE